MFNESFAPLGGSTRGKSIGVLWHEGISGRNAEDVASAFIALIRSLKVIDTIVLWLDNCKAQGKQVYNGPRIVKFISAVRK